MMNNLRRLLAPIERRIFLMLGRALLTAVNNSEKTQKLQMTVLADETVTGVERFQDYGFESYPWEGAEALVTFLGGNRDHGIVVVVNDGRYRPQDLVQGESAMYTDEDATAQDHRVHLKRGKKVDVLGDQVALSGLWAGLRSFIDERFIALFNAHVHAGVLAGGANTAVPTVPMDAASHATSKVKGK